MKTTKRDMKVLAMAACVAMGFGCGAQVEEGGGEDALRTSDLAGTWASPSCEVGGAPGSEFYYERLFTLTETTWALDFTLYTDADCATAGSMATITGPYTLGEGSDTIEGAHVADFTNGTKTLTAFDAGTAGFFEGSGCGEGAWVVGEAKDISQTGCAPLGVEAIDDCPVEYDLIRLEGDELFFGDRSAGMCDPGARTGALQTVPVVLQ